MLVVLAGVALLIGIPYFLASLKVVSTDDAYVNGHVTFVAPRVAGQVARVLVEDNNRVRKGDVLLQLDREPYEVQLTIAQAAVASAEADLQSAQAEAWATAGEARSLRFALAHAIENVDNQVALLNSRVASLQSQRATLDNAHSQYDRVVELAKHDAANQKELDDRKEEYLVAQAKYDEALQEVYQVRVSLGLPPKPEQGDDLTQVPVDLDQTFSAVKQAQFALSNAAMRLGVRDSLNLSPREMIANFYSRDPEGDIDRILGKLVAESPMVKQAEAKLAQTKRQLDQAVLNVKYCDVVSEIDGVVTRRNVNPGDNLIAGQSVMAIRSLAEIWIDANFKETQLTRLRIGQPVDLEVDMYGSKQHFKGRISGFTMGTGSTLALLPPQNATGNFVKVVQRLPVRIDILDYDPDKAPLFVGLSVTPYVHVTEPATGDNAGAVLQPYAMSDEKQP